MRRLKKVSWSWVRYLSGHYRDSEAVLLFRSLRWVWGLGLALRGPCSSTYSDVSAPVRILLSLKNRKRSLEVYFVCKHRERNARERDSGPPSRYPVTPPKTHATYRPNVG